jgi:hypothetical protein
MAACARGQVDERQTARHELDVGSRTPGLEGKAARRPVRPQAPGSQDGPEREEQVVAEVGDERVALRVVGDRADRAEETGMVDRDLQRTWTADDIGDDVGSRGPRDRGPGPSRPDDEIDACIPEHRVGGLQQALERSAEGGSPQDRAITVQVAPRRHRQLGEPVAEPRPIEAMGEPVIDPVDRAGAL